MRGPIKDEQVQLFSRELLSSNLSEKLAYFRGVKIGHPLIDDARTRILYAIEDADSDSLIYVFGPTGVGKTTLLINVMDTIIKKLLPELELDRGRIPVIGIELPTPATGFFNWSETLQELLRAMGEPLIEYKIPPREKLLDMHFPSGERMNICRYRYAYKQAVKYRRPLAVMFDDAHYLNKVPAARLLYQLEFIKSIAKAVRVPHVLFGTYDLLALRNLSGQISRRSIDIHLPRYKQTDLDKKEFAKAVKTFQAHMPIERCPDLYVHLDYLMERSAGCVGILKTWLEQSLVDALRRGDRTVEKEHLERRSYSDEALTKIFIEMAEGEAKLLDGGSEYFLQCQRLNASAQKPASSAQQTDTRKSDTGEKAATGSPGQRNPARDPIGNRETTITTTR
jgi:hypothetical protein